MESIDIVFEFERPLAASELSLLFTKCLSVGFGTIASDDGSTTIYVGESTDYIPREIEIKKAIEWIGGDGQGAIQLKYGEINIQFSVNPDMNSADTNPNDSFVILASADGVYFRESDIFGEGSQAVDRVSDLIDAVGTFNEIALPDSVVGYPTNQMGKPEPELVRKSIDGTSVLIHWLTLVPAKIERQLGTNSPIVYDRKSIAGLGALIVLTEDPNDYAAIEERQSSLISKLD